jgi:hypothetical protein
MLPAMRLPPKNKLLVPSTTKIKLLVQMASCKVFSTELDKK